MEDQDVRCGFSGDALWKTPKPDGCELDWGTDLSLGEVAQSACVGDTISMTATLDSGLVWWRRPGDPTISREGTLLAVLPYGSAVAVGRMRCDSATTGVTCQNTGTGHGFFMSRESYKVF